MQKVVHYRAASLTAAQPSPNFGTIADIQKSVDSLQA